MNTTPAIRALLDPENHEHWMLCAGWQLTPFVQTLNMLFNTMIPDTISKLGFVKPLQIGLLLIVAVNFSTADAPPTAKAITKVYASNKRFYALTDPKLNRTVVFSSSKSAPLWEISGYHPVFFVSGDGSCLVVGHPGGNLLPRNVQAKDTLLSFYTAGKAVGTESVGEIFADLDQLPQTASHLAWGNYFGFEGAHRFVIMTYDQRRIALDCSTGKRLL